MTLQERLSYYNQLVGPHGERLATRFRFQSKPGSDYPRIYLPYDSLLNHESRLLRWTKLWLSDMLSPAQILEAQLILIGHDVLELRDDDVNRLSTEVEEQRAEPDQFLLPEDVDRYRDFVTAQYFLEKGSAVLPAFSLSLIARVLDTIDGDFFAFALLENYALKVGGEVVDPRLQETLDRSYVYVNKMRQRYRERLALTNGHYPLDLSTVLERLQAVESEKLLKFSQEIERQGYLITPLI